MVTRKTSEKAGLTTLRKGQARIVQEIGRKFGTVIDLERSPFVLVEILREYGRRFDEDDGGGGGGGGVEPSSIAVAGPPDPPEPPEPPDPPEHGQFDNSVILKALLTVQRDVKALSKKLDIAASTKTK